MPIPSANLSIRRLCAAQTPLESEEIALIEQLAQSLPLFAELAQADVFIDCPTMSPDVAVVVAEANPPGGRSLYRAPVVGQLALRENEPGVLETLLTGLPTPGRRGVTQEGIPVRQSVVPIFGLKGNTIGALIMEQDITEQLRQESWLGVLSQTTEQLTETLLAAAMKVPALPTLLHEGLLILDAGGIVSYANPNALRFLRDLGGPEEPVGRSLLELPLGFSPADQDSSGVVTRELEAACASFVLRAIPMVFQQQSVGHVILLRDVTEIRAKEKELMIKSVVIKEIHHRVKNNLQTISSLLRLQARRVESPEARQILKESINRITSIATVHEVLSKGGIEQVDVRQMTADIVRQIRTSMLHPEREIAVEVKGDSLVISSAKATSIALIINELVQNAIDHAYVGRESGRVEVSIADLGQTVEVTIADDGTGLPEDFSGQAADQLGLQIVSTLVEHDLKGRLTIRSDGRQGTEVCIAFPKAEGETRHARSQSALGGG
ncbi:MAG: sensor histidine kinase [Bacillota bacterium]